MQNRVYLGTTRVFLKLLFLSRIIFIIPAIKIILQESPGFADILLFLLAGFRFDLMVIGYLLLPVFLLQVSIKFFNKIAKLSGSIIKVYIIFCVTIGTLVSILDMQHYILTNEHFNSLGLQILQSGHFNLNPLFLFTTAAFILLMRSSIRNIFEMAGDRRLEFSIVTSWKKIAFIFLILALMIRSSIGEHHLDLRNAEVTSSLHLNKLVLPSAYALDQALRNRR